MAYEVRLGSTISFDESKEKDVIELVTALTKRHKLGDFIGNLLKDFCDNPELYATAVEKASALGISPCRKKFFFTVSKEVDEMKSKVDAIYETSLKLLVAAEFRKQMGLSDQTDNILAAQFVLQHQLNQLSDSLGISPNSHPFNSNKIIEAHERADDILKYIIDSYGSIVDELRSNMMREIAIGNLSVVQTGVNVNQVQTTDSIKIGAEVGINSSSNTIAATETIAMANTAEADNTQVVEDDIIDFGVADLGALSNFFGADPM